MACLHITARRLAEFLQSVEAEEALLMQRLRDGESRNILLGTPPQPPGAGRGYWELMGVCGTLGNPCNRLKRLVAGGRDAPNAIVVPFRLHLIDGSGVAA